MAKDASLPQQTDPADVVVGYLNFSAGAFDPAAWRAMSDLYAGFETPGENGIIVEQADSSARVATLLRTDRKSVV